MAIHYAVHPGFVRSKNDNDEHWVSVTELARLYGVKLHECIDVAYAHTLNNEMQNRLIHLRPRRDGNYKLPEAS